MGLFIAVLFFHFIIFIFIGLTIFMYFKLRSLVKNNQELPLWICKLGDILKGREANPYVNIADDCALREVHIFLLSMLLINGIVFIVLRQRGYYVFSAIYFCFKLEFLFTVILLMLGQLLKISIFILRVVKKISGGYLNYAPSHVIMTMVVIVSFMFTGTMFVTGFPVKPVEIQIAESRLTIGVTKALELLKEGFQFYNKKPDDKIINHKDNRLYYGELVELTRNGQSYGTVSLTPTWKASDKLKDCVITYYNISGTGRQLSAIKINNKNIFKLKYSDFKNNKIIDVFSLKPADYREQMGYYSFSLQMQTHSYVLWKRYTIGGKFHKNGDPYQYEVRAQHIVWEW